MLSTICARRAGAGLSSEDTRLQFKFAILVSGLHGFPCSHALSLIGISTAFKSLSEADRDLYESPITCPSLHIFGTTDDVIPGGRSFFIHCCSMHHVSNTALQSTAQILPNASAMQPFSSTSMLDCIPLLHPYRYYTQTHRGGHFVPWPNAGTPQRTILTEFFERMSADK
jgi:hypothetical protein